MRKFSPHNLGVWHPLAQQKRAICESFLREITFFTNSQKFSPSKVSHYTVCITYTHSLLLHGSFPFMRNHMTKETYCTESLHAHINRARLTVYEIDVFSRAPHPHTQPLLWEPLQFTTHGRTCCIYLWRLLYVM